MHTYTLHFHRAGGCPRRVADDMARHDGARIIASQSDDACEPDHLRRITILGPNPPTMPRWRTFLVGARIVTAAEANADRPTDPTGLERAMFPARRPDTGA